MENGQQKILSEIDDLMSSLGRQIEALSGKIEELRQIVDKEENEYIGAIDLSIDGDMVPEDDGDLPMFGDGDMDRDDIPSAEPDAALRKSAVIDVMTEKEAWRTDMPGSEVKDVRSAISLNDRVLFINTLFREDPMLFQSVISGINGASSLDDVAGMLKADFPEWDMASDVVYRFMMAVRRKVR